MARNTVCPLMKTPAVWKTEPLPSFPGDHNYAFTRFTSRGSEAIFNQVVHNVVKSKNETISW